MASQLIVAIIRKLHIDAKISLAEQGNDLLEAVAIFSRDADDISIDRGLHLLFGILDGLDDLTGFFDGNTLLELHLLPYGGTGGGFDLSVVQRLEGDSPLDELGLQNVSDSLELVFVGGREDDLVLAVKLNIGMRSLQVVALMDFLKGLLDGIGDFRQVYVANDVERVFGGHCFLVYDKVVVPASNSDVSRGSMASNSCDAAVIGCRAQTNKKTRLVGPGLGEVSASSWRRLDGRTDKPNPRRCECSSAYRRKNR